MLYIILTMLAFLSFIAIIFGASFAFGVIALMVIMEELDIGQECTYIT
jgi:hypothetical protein